MVERFRKSLTVLMYVVVVFLIILGISYAYNMTSIAVDIGTGIYGVDESIYGSTTFDSSNLKMLPILDTDVENNTDNVIKIDFKVRGAENNPDDKPIIYDIALVDLHIDCQFLNTENLKWKLVKNNVVIEESNFSVEVDNAVDGRYMLTQIQQDLIPYNTTDSLTYDDYTFYMWISDICQEEDISKCSIDSEELEEQNELVGRNITGAIEVELYSESKKEHVKKPLSIGTNACANVVYAFFEDGGNLDGQYIEIRDGATFGNYGSLPTPNKEGYVFSGWYLEPTYENRVTDSTTVEALENIFLYAKWSPNT